LEKCLISDTVPLILKEDLKEFMVLVPKYEVIHLTLDYLAHDTELHELSAYIQSEEFPKIHALVEYIKEYKPVSANMCIFLKPESDREYICSVSTGVCVSLF
jgi:hypothetical protein